MRQRLGTWSVAVFVAGMTSLGPTGAAAQDCAARIDQVQAMANAMTRSARKTSALNQLDNARTELAKGDERRCLLYVRSAESSIEEWRRDGRD